MAEGRFFSREFRSDSAAYILNEAAVKAMEMEDPIGKRFAFNESYLGEGPIIGIIKDFHFTSLHNEIGPLCLKIFPEYYAYMFLQISPENVSETLSFLENKWNEFTPEYPFVFNFLDETIDELYRSEQKIETIFRYFTFLAIFISCLGLFGLASFLAEKRMKEIGIRKVLGADMPDILRLLSEEFIVPVLVANMIAWPVAYFAMSSWLQNFAYHTHIGLLLFITAGLLSFSIALLSVSYQSIKAARVIPVEVLRFESCRNPASAG